MAHVLAVKPGGLKLAQRKLLEKHGVVVIEMDDPSDLRIVRVESAEIDANALTWAAIAAIDDAGLPAVAQKFAANLRAVVARKMKAQTQSEQGVDQ